MMDYVQTAQDALAALIEAGGANPGAQITIKAAGGYNPATSKTTAPTTVTYAAVALVFEYGFRNAGEAFADGTMIKAGDREIYIAALLADGSPLPAAPVNGAACVAPDGQTYTLENVKPLAPAGVPVLYQATIRR